MTEKINNENEKKGIKIENKTTKGI